MRTRLLHCLAAVFALTFVPLTPAAPLAPLGPGAVIELHERLFAAIDRDDREAIASMLMESSAGIEQGESGEWLEPAGFLVFGWGAAGPLAAARDPQAGVAALASLAEGPDKSADRWRTKIERAWADCDSERVSYAMLEFRRERTHAGQSEVRRFRSTSLVAYTKTGWKLWHLHVSPAAPARDAAVAPAGGGAR